MLSTIDPWLLAISLPMKCSEQYTGAKLEEKTMKWGEGRSSKGRKRGLVTFLRHTE